MPALVQYSIAASAQAVFDDLVLLAIGFVAIARCTEDSAISSALANVTGYRAGRRADNSAAGRAFHSTFGFFNRLSKSAS